MFKDWLVIVSVIALILTACAPVTGGNGVVFSTNGTVTVSRGIEKVDNVPGNAEAGTSDIEDITNNYSLDTRTSSPPGKISIYQDPLYKFSVEYPGEFVFRQISDENLLSLSPKPVASFIIMNPKTATSDAVDLEPADLEIRIYEVNGASSLDAWLKSKGLLSNTMPPRPFQTKRNVSGIELCAATLIGPGCSYFFLGNAWIYGLTPATLEGETILHSFTLIP